MDKYAEVTLNRGMSFDVEVNGHKFLIDADEKVGGENRGRVQSHCCLPALVAVPVWM